MSEAKPLTAIERIERSFDAGKTSLIELAGKTAPFDFERVKRIVVSALRRDPNLAACDPATIIQSVQDAVRLGLEPNGPQGHCYLVPYGTKCQMILGYKGLIALARRSGEVLSIEAHLIYENDQYDVAFGSDPRIVHKPNLRGDRGEPIAAYAIAKLAGGGVQSDVMRIDEIDKIMRASPQKGERGPWKDHRSEMQRKTMIRRLAKTLPMQVALADQLEREEEIDITPTRKGSRAAPELPPGAPTFSQADDEMAAANLTPEAPAAEPVVVVAPVAAPAHDHREEIAMLDEDISSMDDADTVAHVREKLETARDRKTNPLPKADYDALARKWLDAKKSLGVKGGK